MRLESNDFATLYDRHSAELLGFFVRRTYDPEVGVDLLAETFAVAFKDRREFRGENEAAVRACLSGTAPPRLQMSFAGGRSGGPLFAGFGAKPPRLPDPEYDR